MSFLTERYFQVLDEHQVYEAINSSESLIYFMENHVICAWAYNTILRSLQKDLIALSQPLNSEPHKEAIRLISEIILEEEVEDIGDGRFVSHLELYLEAMQDLDCDTATILGFFDIIESGLPLTKAIEHANFSLEVLDYARATASILEKPLHVRAAALFYEGESFIPDRFLYQIDGMRNSAKVDRFLDYLERHIEGIKRPGFSAAGRLVELLCGDDPALNREAEKMAEKVMRQRIELWNALLHKLRDLPVRVPLIRPALSHLRLVT